ncbi:MAG: nicotinamide riboside transporter PnuC [Bacteroidetes bacterium]|nr:nicotinamide riboside transporter PnuC [Bacteroidota bacterium]
MKIFEQILQNILNTSFLEIFAVLFGVLSVWYARKENILVYPTGIVNVLIYVYLSFKAGLYALMGINGFYFIMSVYGWYIWTRKDENKKVLSISSCNLTYHLINMISLTGSFLILRFVLIKFTDSTVPTLDSLTTAIFIVSMWLMARKKIENWIGWIIGDVICIPLYASKGLVFTSVQYIIFLVLAIMGYMEWRKKIHNIKLTTG